MSHKDEWMRALAAAGIILLEYYSMQPYHSPVLAALWRYLSILFQKTAAFFGRLALNAEFNYYVAVASGT